jgi:Polyketide cyclase / dehydrase and lipid transport
MTSNPKDEMPSLSVVSTADLAVDPESVWTLIGGFGSLLDWTSDFVSCELAAGGRTRRLTTTTGDVIVERLLAFDDAARSYSYGVLESPFPVIAPWATLQVLPQPNGAGTHVEWTGQFTANGVSDAEATQLVQTIYDDGLAALVAHFGPN